MGFHVAPNPGDRGEDRATTGAAGRSEAQLAQRLLRDGRQVIARGALICPDCDLPLPGRPTIAASKVVHCGWCGHAAPARALLRRDVFDTAANRVELVARLAR